MRTDPDGDRYLNLRELAEYSGLAESTLRKRLTHPTAPLPHYRVGPRVLVKRSEFDAWVQTVTLEARADREAGADRVAVMAAAAARAIRGR